MGPPRFELGSPAPKAGRITRLPYGPAVFRQIAGFKKSAIRFQESEKGISEF